MCWLIIVDMCLSVCMSVSLLVTTMSPKNGWTDQGAGWNMDLAGPTGLSTPHGKRQFREYLQAYCKTHTFNGPFSGTTRVSRYQKGKTNLDFTEARDSEWQWHQLGHMQVCTSLHTDSHASTPTTQFFTGRMPFLSPNQQRQKARAYCEI